MERNIYVLSEIAGEYAHWNVMLLEAIRQRAAYKKYEVRMIGLAQLEKLPPSAGPVIAMNLSHSWGEVAMERLRALGMRGVVLSMLAPQPGEDMNIIALDQRKAAVNAVKYFYSLGRRRIAFVANNPRSPNDQQKIIGMQEACAECGLFFSDGDIFNYAGDLAECTDEFIARCAPYDAVICANDVSAILLVKSQALARRKRIPEDLYLISFGNTLLARLIHPSITSLTLDYAEVGRIAVDNVIYMRKNPAIASQQTLVRIQMVLGETTAFRPFTPAAPPRPAPAAPISLSYRNFYQDQTTRDVLRVEVLLSRLDATDLSLLLLMLRGRKKAEILDALFISESTYKYRLRRLAQMTERRNKEEMLALIQEWVAPEMLEKYLQEQA